MMTERLATQQQRAMPDSYTPRLLSRSRFVEVRRLRLHVREWGDPRDTPLVLLHGHQDASATFQFVVDALRGAWCVLAPDWRGHGLSARATGGYWFQDYAADLDALLPALVGDHPVPLVGHSLGGNVASIYAGLRPERVSRLASLDGFGLPDRKPEDAPRHLRRWLDGWRDPPVERARPDLDSFSARLRVSNPRLDVGRARFLAEHLTHPVAGGFAWAFDPLHRLPFGVMARAAEWEACVRQITAPVLWIGSGAPFPPGIRDAALRARAALIGAEFHSLPGTGHNLHHDAPEEVARLLEGFLGCGRD